LKDRHTKELRLLMDKLFTVDRSKSIQRDAEDKAREFYELGKRHEREQSQTNGGYT
jgi:hypothetical protein